MKNNLLWRQPDYLPEKPKYKRLKIKPLKAHIPKDQLLEPQSSCSRYLGWLIAAVAVLIAISIGFSASNTKAQVLLMGIMASRGEEAAAAQPLAPVGTIELAGIPEPGCHSGNGYHQGFF